MSDDLYRTGLDTTAWQPDAALESEYDDDDLLPGAGTATISFEETYGLDA